MLKVNFDIEVSRDSSELTFTDRTTGWGDISIDDIAAVVFYHKNPFGTATKLYTKFLPSQGSIVIPASYLDSRYVDEILKQENQTLSGGCCGFPPITTFAPILDLGVKFPVSWACPTNPQKKWGDGCNSWRYELYMANATVDYAKAFRMRESDLLYVRLNGSWVNYTDYTSYEGDYRHLFITNTSDRIDQWEIRSGLDVIDCGPINPIKVRPNQLESDHLTLAGYAEYNVVFHSELAKRFSDLSVDIITGDSVNHMCHKPLDVFAGQLYRYQSLVADPGCSCDEAAHHIRSINMVLDEIQGGATC